jgi:hypothetical protein
MTTTEADEEGSEAAFAVLMIVVSVLIFLAVRRSERVDTGSSE